MRTGVNRLLVALAAAATSIVVALGGGATAPAATATLYANVGPGYTITLTDAGGAPVQQLTPGTYTIVVNDQSTNHNFHLTGAGGVNLTTTEAFVGQVTWNVDLVAGAYHFACDPHADGMFGDFTVVAPDTTPPETTITAGPSGPVTSTSASFSFSASEPGSTFECSLDGSPFAGCASPKSYTALANGQHTFQVRATDAAANVDPTPDTRTWTVDTVAPDTSITSGPSGTVGSASATFGVSSTEPGATFQCSLDGAAFAACSSPVSYAGLGNGAHTFRVRAVDAAGNVDASPASRSWTIDATPPETTILSSPSGTVTSADATFEFQSNKPGATFQCSLDGAAFEACTSPTSYFGLSDGAHTFQVRSVDTTGTPDASPASAGWTIDTTAPETTIDSGPAATVNTGNATFRFSSSEAGSTFECSVDGAGFGPCTSPLDVAGLADGTHTLEVRATDAVGNVDGTPATASWTVDTAAPDTTLASGPSDTVGSTSASFGFSSSEAGSSFECSLDNAAFAACTSPKAYSGLADGAHTFRVRAIDGAGNVDATPVSRSWTIDSGALYGTVGPGYTITLTNAAGTPVTQLPSGTHRIVVHDQSASHNFHLLGPGTDRSTTVPFVGEVIWTITLDGGAYHFQCDPHAGMSGDFTVVSTDTTAPETTIDSGPSGTVASTAAAFGFSATEASSFQCSLDGAAFAACSSPQSYSGLADGAHTFQVRATDAAGNTDASPATRSWSVDTTPPETSLDAGPAGDVLSSLAEFAFSSPEPGAAFECSLDGAAYAACTSPAAYAALAAGGHTFRVRAVDAVGNVDATPATRSWTILGLDTTPPETTIDSGPTGAVSTGSATFVFSASEPGSTFECALDGAVPAACNSPVSFATLAAGDHSFRVVATDAAGNVDPTPAVASWTYDLGAPDTSVLSGPTGVVATGAATFEFASSEAGSSFECSLDSAAFAACSSPRSYSGLADGVHSFEVRAIDAAGNVDPTPAARSWTIALPPETTIDSGPSGTVATGTATFAFSASKSGSTFECALDGAAFTVCTSPISYSALASGSHSFAVRAKSVLGTVDATPASRSWSVAPPAAAQIIATGMSFNVSTLKVPAGSVTLSLLNQSSVWHNIAIRGNGIDVQGPVVGQGAVSTVTANLTSGVYEFYCSVPGHAEAGMKGTLVVGDATAPPPTPPPPPPAPPAGGSTQLVTTGLAFNTGTLRVQAGHVTISMLNQSPIGHNVAIRGHGVDVQGSVVGQGGISSVTADLEPGTYEFYCSVPGHAEAGMRGTLIVSADAPPPAPPPTTTPPGDGTGDPAEPPVTKEPSAQAVPPALRLRCTGTALTFQGTLVRVTPNATSLQLRVQKATAATKRARKLARKFAGKQLALLLHSKTVIKRGGTTVVVQELAAGDGATVAGRLCEVNGRRPSRWTASVVSARPVAGGDTGQQGGLDLTATAVKFDQTHLEAKAGSVTITLRNNSPLEHNVAIRGNGVDVKGKLVGKGGTSTATATLAPGEYVFYCSVPGHEQAGMKGTLTVKP